MQHLTFWLDPVSPYAYLAFERLPQVLEGVSVEVQYRPVLFAGLLRHWGQKGPAEIEPKRVWTYRQVAWIAREQGVELALPATHPFNPLALLRLAWAATPAGLTPNRRICEAVLHHVWRGGAAPDDAGRLAALRTELAPSFDPDAAEAKQRLRDATDDAVHRGVFGVPTIEADGRLYWGLDALSMLRAAIGGDPWFAAGGGWDEAARPRPGVGR